jgi:hypothetical protein
LIAAIQPILTMIGCNRDPLFDLDTFVEYGEACGRLKVFLFRPPQAVRVTLMVRPSGAEQWRPADWLRVEASARPLLYGLNSAMLEALLLNANKSKLIQQHGDDLQWTFHQSME